MNRHERRAAAKGSKTAQTSSAAATPAALHEAGLRHLTAGNLLEAQVCCQKALALDAEHADTLHLTGLLALQSKQYDHAVEWISRAIRKQPKTDYLTSLGTALQKQGRRDDAIAIFEKATQLKPDDAALWGNLGKALAEMGRPERALQSCQRALALKPDHWGAADQCATILLVLGRAEEALAYIDLCDSIRPNRAPTLQKRAAVLFGLNKFNEGLAEIERAYALDPANAEICNNVGVFLRRLGREEEALAFFDKALAIHPNFVGALHNKAFALAQLQRFAEAIAVYDAIKAIEPDNAEADMYAALLHLLTGNLERGWAGREARSRIAKLQITHFNSQQPRWLGQERLDGKTIVLHTEEGLGDSIQFARYAPMVAALGARVILVVQDALCPLLSGMDGISQCLPTSATALPAFDYYCPLSSLPLAFATSLDTIPAARAYLSAPSDSRRIWEERLGPHEKLRVGLVWSGNPAHLNDYNRSIPLSKLATILDVDASFLSLQKDPRPADRATLLTRPEIIDHTDHLTDFAETAALISCLDLVVTIDSSVAHLAGALGCPTWILLPYTPDWRWLLDRDDSPWYPSVRLFRQDQTRDYASVVARVRRELMALISARP
ncbi:MAG TPA: tetratricopeptide repeat protein [Bradyrhizobium sp.]|uniref:tetratricopeptide repeat protein n=1 Tax=Bradyrhizobium sp. TaxID=376 RepID=UPI002D7EC129|nr:tetratricopeptide repeat protein [Bradyrhizobium sp.]HET7888906.1 tetratricopeptide repeat protein [Bradyrhizobium sp.]